MIFQRKDHNFMCNTGGKGGGERSDRFPAVSNLSKTPTYFISANGLFRCEDLILEQIIMRDKTECKIKPTI